MEPVDSKTRRWQGRWGGGSAGDAVYGLGMIGAAVYYIQHAATFGAGALGVLKAIIWPALLLHQVLGLLKM